MIGKHVVIDTLDNFKAKLNLIPSSAIVLIKDVGQIYAHGTYFGAQKTYSLLTKTADGLAPKGGTSASSLIKDGATEWVLTVTNGENPSWRRLPDNAFNSLLYTLPAATTTELGGIKVGKLYTATFSDLVGKYYKINIDKDGLAYVEVPWTDNDYRVEQVNTSVLDEDFRVVFSGTAVNDTKTETLRKSSKLLFNPVSGKLTSTTFEGNLDGKYINKLTDYSIAKQEAAISVNDSLNQALGKLEYKLDSAYNWYKGVVGTDEDEIINKWDEIVDFVKNVSEGTDLVDEFVTRKTALTITGLKTFESNSDEVGVSLILKNKGWLGNMSTAMDFYNGRSYVVPNARIETKMVGNGRAGGTLIFYTQSKHDSTNPNPNGLTERLRIDDLGTITASTDLLVNKNITGAKLITIGGTSSQFLKGDGTLDSNLYYSVKGLKYNADQAWDWNDITEAGTYKIQKGNPIANHPKRDDTANSYPFGLALVLQGIKNDSEKRITLIYFPHDWVNYNDIPLYLRMRNGANLTWTSWAKIPSVDFVTKLCAKYLPLTGGTLTNTLQIGSDNNVDYMMLRLVRSGHAVTVNNTDADAFVCFGSYANGSFTNERALIIGDNGLRYSDNGLKSNYKIWHAGNDGEDSGLDADTLDGLHANDFYDLTGGKTIRASENNVVDLNNYKTPGTYNIKYSSDILYVLNRPVDRPGLLLVTLNTNTEGYVTQQYKPYDSGRTFWRFIDTYSNVWSEWKLISTDLSTYNAPTATKLATPVKLWGNNFDGSADVSGRLTIKDSAGVYHYDKDDTYYGYIGHSSSNVGMMIYNEKSKHRLVLYDSGKAYINTSLGVCASNPSQALEVGGVGLFQQGVIVNNDYYYQIKNSEGTSCGVMTLSKANNFTLGWGGAERGYNTYIDGNNTYFRYSNKHSIGIVLNSNGNLTIGDLDRCGTDTKLYVDGVCKVKSIEVTASNISGYGLTVDGISFVRPNIDKALILSAENNTIAFRPKGSLSVENLMLLHKEGHLTVSSTVESTGFIKTSSSDSYVLLGGGGHKKISDLLLTSELTTFEKTLNVTSDWMDTGIAYDNLPANGSYIVLVYVWANDATGQMYDCYWTGVMSWFVTTGGKTNDVETDEILLHRSGHAYNNTIYLRTIMTSGGSSSEGLKLLIAANKNIGKEYKYTFKFKRII